MYYKRDLVKNTKSHVIIELPRFLSLCFHFLLNWGSSGKGGKTSAGAPVARAGSPCPTLKIRLLMLTLVRAFANKHGQKGSAFTPTVLNRALILYPCHLIIVQNEGRVDVGKLQDHSAGECWAGAAWSPANYG